MVCYNAGPSTYIELKVHVVYGQDIQAPSPVLSDMKARATLKYTRSLCEHICLLYTMKRLLLCPRVRTKGAAIT